MGARFAISVQHTRQILPSIRAGQLGDGLGWTDSDHLAAAIAALGTKVDHPVSRLDHFQIVLDDYNRAPFFYQTAESGEEFADVVKM